MISRCSSHLLVAAVTVLIFLASFYVKLWAPERAAWQAILQHAIATPDATVRCEDPPEGVGVTGEFCRWKPVPNVDPGVRALLQGTPSVETRLWVEHVIAHAWPDAVWATLEALEERTGDEWAARIVDRFATTADSIREVYARHAIVASEAGFPRRQIVREWISELGDLESPVGWYGRRLPEGHFDFGGLLASWWGVKYWERNDSTRVESVD